MPETFAAIRADIDHRLTDAANNRRAPMHTPVVGTADADLRIMVLRGYDRDSGTLRFHTDARAPKASLIGDAAAVGVLFYDKAEKIQIRCRGAGRIVRDGPRVDAAWAASDNFALRCYLGEGPGTPSAVPISGLPAAFEGVEPNDEQVLPARPNFALLLVEVETFDWFSLAHTGHRRAVIEGGNGRWVSP